MVEGGMDSRWKDSSGMDGRRMMEEGGVEGLMEIWMHSMYTWKDGGRDG